MQVKNSRDTSVPFRLDPMSKTRLVWVQSQVLDFKSSRSMVLRRALDVYVRHLENVLADPGRTHSEMIALKSCAAGGNPPWKRDPDFALAPGKPLSLWVREAIQNRFTRFMDSDPFGRRANAMETDGNE